MKLAVGVSITGVNVSVSFSNCPQIRWAFNYFLASTCKFYIPCSFIFRLVCSRVVRNQLRPFFFLVFSESALVFALRNTPSPQKRSIQRLFVPLIRRQVAASHHQKIVAENCRAYSLTKSLKSLEKDTSKPKTTF